MSNIPTPSPPATLLPPIQVPLVFFYPNTHTTSITNIFSKRSQTLKLSLAQTLTRYYPFAGKIKEVHLSVEWNDVRVYYVEARVNSHLSPDTRLTHGLLPREPINIEPKAGSNVATVQVNFFKCGGIALTMCTSHKIMDGLTYISFIKLWADTARGLKTECPSFIASALFLQNSSLPKDSSMVMWPSTVNQSKYVTSRFLLDASTLVGLKAKAASSKFVPVPSCVEAVLWLIWESAMAALNALNGSPKPSVFSLAVNLRRKTFPHLPKLSVGNLIWSGCPIPETLVEPREIVTN
ncbi:hypothetical protein Acr_08g0000410 [Actinidia rufa]|uniref:HXXXD-type acyl-transferase family protein n=1 Tax=Actinidia rufa TaxID=165716 RepID=A0A7J0EYX1_9ERIC|nr:hypothetical protein Acr_08g0000410 [Actinidia rufa]